MPIVSYRDLEAWILAMEFAQGIYTLTAGFPAAERYGLTAQIRRAAVAIPSHVAEGHQQGTTAYRHFVVIALGSLAEVETQIELAFRLQLVPAEQVTPLAQTAARLRRLLHGLKRSLELTMERRSGPRSPIPDPYS